jgi:large subunit ribosomal protein L2
LNYVQVAAAKIGRSAGSAVQLVAKDGPYAQLRMPSGEIRNVDVRCRATVGTLEMQNNQIVITVKQDVCVGRASAHAVRRVVMNPVDHPHGGGEGKTSGGRHPVSPRGTPEKRTRKKKAE